MSESRFAGRSYYLESPEGRELLGASYDDCADVLYLWRGKKPVEAVSFPTDEGPVLRVHPKTGELVGITLMDWHVFWEGKERIELRLPAVGRSESEATATESEREHRQLVLA